MGASSPWRKPSTSSVRAIPAAALVGATTRELPGGPRSPSTSASWRRDIAVTSDRDRSRTAAFRRTLRPGAPRSRSASAASGACAGRTSGGLPQPRPHRRHRQGRRAAGPGADGVATGCSILRYQRAGTRALDRRQRRDDFAPSANFNRTRTEPATRTPRPTSPYRRRRPAIRSARARWRARQPLVAHVPRARAPCFRRSATRSPPVRYCGVRALPIRDAAARSRGSTGDCSIPGPRGNSPTMASITS